MHTCQVQLVSDSVGMVDVTFIDIHQEWAYSLHLILDNNCLHFECLVYA